VEPEDPQEPRNSQEPDDPTQVEEGTPGEVVDELGPVARHRLDARLVPGLARMLADEEAPEDAAGPGPDAKEEPAPKLALAVLGDAIREGASDLHLDPQREGLALRLRLDGHLVDAGLLPPELGQRLLGQMRAVVHIDPVQAFVPEESRRTLEVDGRELDLRIVTTPCLGGQKQSIRLLDARQLVTGAADLGLRETDVELLDGVLRMRAGMVLVTGPTGSGKTTTLYALLLRLREQESSILALEDPVEYRIDGVTQIQVDEAHDLTFASGFRTMLRMDPDYLLVGEIRDEDSARTAVRAAASGHGVLTTLHCRDAVGAVTSLRSRGLSDHDVATTLSLVVSQRLVHRLCRECRTRRAPTEEEVRWLRALGREAPEETWTADGCDACRGRGTRGRSGIFEVWRPDAGSLDRILGGAGEYELRRRARERDHHLLLDDALAKVADGVTSLAELRTVPGLAPPPDLGDRPV